MLSFGCFAGGWVFFLVVLHWITTSIMMRNLANQASIAVMIVAGKECLYFSVERQPEANLDLAPLTADLRSCHCGKLEAQHIK